MNIAGIPTSWPHVSRCQCQHCRAVGNVTYRHLVEVAGDLLADGAKPEYRRGIVNLISEVFGVDGMTTSERMEQVDSDIQREIEVGEK